MDLAPAKWIWLPSQRCLPNTFVLFRRELELAEAPREANGWILADSRYRLSVNGRRVQWGPAPADPRWPEADPVDLTPFLAKGLNVIGVEVCYFGQGDGTWAMGAPGLLARFDFDGRTLVTDAEWSTLLDRAHRPGLPKRWYLRALQEQFDARRHPYGWDAPGFRPGPEWTSARELGGDAGTPALFAGGPECFLPADRPPTSAAAAANPPAIRERRIPLMRESWVAAEAPVETGRVFWRRDPDDWFESRMPDSFAIAPEAFAPTAVPATGEGLYFTYKLGEQVVGFPGFTIEAAEGTVVELMVQEAHDPANGPRWLDTHFFQWTRFICREGINTFETFDSESCMWLQLHVHNVSRPFTIRDVGVRRRIYAWPETPRITCAEPALQRLFDASVNTLLNSAQETVVDGMGRERQQYSGDCGHQLHAIRYAFGETRLPARYLATYSQGMTLDGYFLDCWPGYDRLARIAQRQMGATRWGPLLDHGVGLNFDCWNHYLETGDREALCEPYPRLRTFAAYLQGLRRDDGLLPVEDIGVPTVWMDHDAYRLQSHKQCAFNLYVAAMFQHALAKIAGLFGDDPEPFRQFGRELEAATVARFWDRQRRLFVVNPGEPEARLCDRSLATAILFDQCPGGDTAATLWALAEFPPELGLSYPPNAVWRYWALAKGGRTEVIVRELREKWAVMPSVLSNNTLQEDWRARCDSTAQFSHCPLAPLVMLYQCLAGIAPTSPGFATCDIRPQLADIGDVDVTARTPPGDIRFVARKQSRGHALSIEVPAGCAATLMLPDGTRQPIEGRWEGGCPSMATATLEAEVTVPSVSQDLQKKTGEHHGSFANSVGGGSQENQE